MNNELIKFRAWDGQRMLNRTLFDRNWYTKDNKCVRRAMPDDTHSLVIMQYIGLNDSNGVEIYESDIFDYLGIIEVVTIDYRHGIRSMLGRDGFSKSYCDGKVIGNSYENPDLAIAIKQNKNTQPQASTKPCPACHTSGSVNYGRVRGVTCTVCDGKGRIKEDK